MKIHFHTEVVDAFIFSKLFFEFFLFDMQDCKSAGRQSTIKAIPVNALLEIFEVNMAIAKGYI